MAGFEREVSDSSVDQIAVDNVWALPVCSFASGTLSSLRGVALMDALPRTVVKSGLFWKKWGRGKGNMGCGFQNTSLKAYSATFLM